MKKFILRVCYKLKIIINSIRYHFYFRNPKKTNLYQHAKYELDLLLETLKTSKDPSDYKEQKKLNNNILKCIEAFCEYGHSGFSSQYAINNLIRLLNYEPIMPLYGTNDEWMHSYYETIDENSKKVEKIVYQNKRYSKLFKCIFIDTETGEKIREEFQDINIPSTEWKDIKFPYFPGDTSME